MLMNVSDVYFDVVAGAEDVLAGNVSPLHHSHVHQGRNYENWKKNPLGCVSISKPIIFQDPNPVEKAGRSGQEIENNFDFDFRLWFMIIYDL